MDYEIVKIIKEDDKKQVCIIKKDNKICILKKAKTNDKSTIHTLKNEVLSLLILEKTSVSPKLIDFKFDINNNYLIEEFIKGSTINKIKYYDASKKVSLILKIIEAVTVLHKNNVIHCDLKPDNIVLDDMGNIKLIDFGISINNGENYFKGYGSIPYCSRAQAKREKLDKTTDVYSLGIILYEIITGTRPFIGKDKEEILENKKKGNYIHLENKFLEKLFEDLFLHTRKFEDLNNLVKIIEG